MNYLQSELKSHENKSSIDYDLSSRSRNVYTDNKLQCSNILTEVDLNDLSSKK